MKKTKNQLTPVEYWEWRTTIAEWNKGKEELKNRLLLQTSMEKDIEIARLKTALFKHDTENFKAEVGLLEKEYKSFKVKLEERLEASLDGCVINNNFEVIKLEDSNNKK